VNLQRLLVSYLAPYRRQIIILVVFQAFQTAASLLLPILNAELINFGVLRGDNAFIRETGWKMLGLTLIQVGFTIAAVRLGAMAAMGFGRDIRRELFDRAVDYSAREVGQFGAPSLINRITNDVQQVLTLVVMIMTMMVTAPLTFAIGIVLAMKTDVGLSVVLAVAIPFLVTVMGVLVSLIVPSFQKMQQVIDRLNQILREQISGVRVMRAFGREPEEVTRFAEANVNLAAVGLKTGRMFAVMFPTVIGTLNAAAVAVVWLGAGRVDRGQLQIGSLVAYQSFLVQILMSVVGATFVASMIPRASVAADRISEVLNVRSSLTYPNHPITPANPLATVEFQDVEFSYDGAERPVLSGVNLVARPGQTTAIVGSTGSGKTSLVSLIPRLFDATSGSVLVGGTDVSVQDPEALAAMIGFVPQRPFLFSGTVASNLRFARPEASDNQLWAALEVAQVADFVRAMPKGLDAPITQGGSNVSGGQRQRLSIARALVVDPSIYVFDDSLSALDLETDARLREALVPVTRHATVILVAQRVSTIVDADQIVVLNDGEIIGLGSYDELLRSCPTFVEIVESQQGATV